MYRKNLPLSWLLCACLATPSAIAQVYRWTDEQGRTQMGDRPPAGVQAQLISGKKATSTPSAQEQANAQARQDAWARVLRDSAQQEPQEQSNARPAAPERGTGSHAAPQGNCAFYQHLVRSLTQDGSLQSCNGAHCRKADAQQIEAVQREAREACAKR